MLSFHLKVKGIQYSVHYKSNMDVILEVNIDLANIEKEDGAFLHWIRFTGSFVVPTFETAVASPFAAGGLMML